MISLKNANRLAIPRDFATHIKNGRFSESFGAVEKDTGWDISEIMAGAPVNLMPILSMAFYPYDVILDNGDITRYGRFYIQVDGDPLGLEHGLNYWYREYDYQVGVWGAWQGSSATTPFSEEHIYGTTKADRIRWSKFPNVVRGACGAYSNSNPLWIGYVDRGIDQDKGFFRTYTYPNPRDRYGISDVIVSEGIPQVTAGIKLLATHHHGEDEEYGFYRKALLLIVLPEYDGVQIANIDHIDNFVFGSYEYYKTLIIPYTDDLDYYRYDLSLAVVLNLGGSALTPMCPRLTGFHIYKCESGYEPYTSQGEKYSWSTPLLVRRIDSQTGTDYVMIRDWQFINNSPGTNIWIANLGPSGWVKVDDEFIDFWIEIKISEGNFERYRITDSNTSSVTFIASADTQMVTSTRYVYSIRERWVSQVVDEVFDIKLKLDTIGLINSAAPPYFPEPNKIEDEDYDIPQITANYKASIHFENRHIIGNCFYNGEYHPLMMRYSDVDGSDFAGHDLFVNEHIIPALAGDEIMGYASSLKMLSVFTKQDIFRYMFEDGGAPVLQDTPYNVGLVAPDSLVTIDGIHFFVGQEGNRISKYKYDGIHKPERIGDRIQDDLTEAINQPGVVKEMIQGFHNKNANRYDISINRFSNP